MSSVEFSFKVICGKIVAEKIPGVATKIVYMDDEHGNVYARCYTQFSAPFDVWVCKKADLLSFEPYEQKFR